MLSWEYEPLSTWPGGSSASTLSSSTSTPVTEVILKNTNTDLTPSSCLSLQAYTNTNNSSPSEQMPSSHSTSIDEDLRESIDNDSIIPRSTSSPVNCSPPPFCTSTQPTSPSSVSVSGNVNSSAIQEVSTDRRISSPPHLTSNANSSVSTPSVLPILNQSYVPQTCCSSMYCHSTYSPDSSMSNQYTYGTSVHDSNQVYNCCGPNQNKHNQHNSLLQSLHHQPGPYHYPSHHSSVCTTCSSHAPRDKSPIYSNGCESISHNGSQQYFNHMDCEFCIKEMPNSQIYPQVQHQQHITIPPSSYMQAPSSFEKFKIANTTGPLRPAVPIHKNKRRNSSVDSANNPLKGKSGRATSPSGSATVEGNTSNPAAGLERDSKMAKEMTIALNAIPGMEKVRWQSIIQSTRGPEVGDRETQRRVKEAEVLVGKVFGGDVRKMLTLLMNEHLDFLVKFVGTTLSTSRRGHKKVRDQVFNALKEIKERESELEGDAESEVNEEQMS